MSPTRYHFSIPQFLIRLELGWLPGFLSVKILSLSDRELGTLVVFTQLYFYAIYSLLFIDPQCKASVFSSVPFPSITGGNWYLAFNVYRALDTISASWPQFNVTPNVYCTVLQNFKERCCPSLHLVQNLHALYNLSIYLFHPILRLRNNYLILPYY